MPKSRRGKRKGSKTFMAPAVQAPIATTAGGPSPPAPVPKPKAPAMADQATNIGAELRRIGILAGIIVVIMVILALIFA